jgi:ribA/ribD-fused uncharacterized protein
MKFEGLDGKEHIYFYLKDDEHGWLSNFYPSMFVYGGMSFPTVEHFYQSMKAMEPNMQNWIAFAPKPYHAMRAGRNLRMDKGEMWTNWEEVKVEIMLTGLRNKFGQVHLRQLLLDTGDAILHEDSPSDKFWGVKGCDQLGKCLMEVRQEIRNGIEND